MSRPSLPEDRPCARCRNVKPREAYGNRHSTLGVLRRRSKCKACEAEVAALGPRAHAHRRRAYGLSPDDYQRMLDSQGSRCAICREPFSKRIHIDHDHRTGKVRGALCAGCNRSIAIFDNPDLFAKATTYLENAA